MPANTPRGYTYPLYTDPANFPAQTQDFAQDVDTDVAALVASANTALNAPSARISSVAPVVVPPNNSTLMTFSTEEYDNAALANLGVNNERLTFAVPGTYLIHAEVSCTANFNATFSGRALLMEFSLGAAFNVGNIIQGISNRDSQIALTYMYKATNPADFVRIRIRHDSGANVTAESRTFSITKVGP
jgi:hypothetical protein